MFTWEWLTETFVYEDGWLYLRSTGKVRGTKWRARIWVEGNRIELGSYNTVEEAQAAFAEAADRFYGKFAEVNRNG